MSQIPSTGLLLPTREEHPLTPIPTLKTSSCNQGKIHAKSGQRSEIRTGDPMDHKLALSPLSYWYWSKSSARWN